MGRRAQIASPIQKPRLNGDLRAKPRPERTFFGRERELSLLTAVLRGDRPAVIYLHGIAGIGKSRLIGEFAERARPLDTQVIVLDGRAIEPTEQGLLRALGRRVGAKLASLDEITRRLHSLGPSAAVVIDHYEVLKLLDSWLRNTFVPRLPEGIVFVVADREAPAPAWAADLGPEVFCDLEVDALAGADALELLARFDVAGARATSINRVVQGHPLALILAASALGAREPSFGDVALQHVIHELTQLYVAEVADPVTRHVLEAACVLRRVTVSLLRSMLGDIAPHDAFTRLASLPFIYIDVDGLHVHDAVKGVIAASLRASDPDSYSRYRRAAWAQLRSELSTAAPPDLWRYTADMLYLLENPVIREAFFPTGAPAYSVEPARARDADAIRSIWQRHEEAGEARSLASWLSRVPGAFSVARDHAGTIVGFYCLALSEDIPNDVEREDPLVHAWLAHLRDHPLPKGQTALLLRRWLSADDGEKPSAVQAACWLDIKRTYIALRPALRRVYLTLREVEPYAAVATSLGFELVATADIKSDGVTFHTVMLDFGPSSVTGWLSKLVAGELGVVSDEVLDVDARELVIDGAHVKLTRLEFALFKHLRDRAGKAVAREDIIRDVWGYEADVGSNVVEAVVKTLRKKLGARANTIETISGYGYKLKTTT